MTSISKAFQVMSDWMPVILALAPVATAQEGPAESNGTVVIEPEGGDRLWVFAESPEELGSGGEFHI